VSNIGSSIDSGVSEDESILMHMIRDVWVKFSCPVTHCTRFTSILPVAGRVGFIPGGVSSESSILMLGGAGSVLIDGRYIGLVIKRESNQKGGSLKTSEKGAPYMMSCCCLNHQIFRKTRVYIFSPS
jgi:hypothetical protein